MNKYLGIIMMLVLFGYLCFSVYDMITEEKKIRKAYKVYKKALLYSQAEEAGRQRKI